MENWTTPEADIYSVAEETKSKYPGGSDFSSESSTPTDLKDGLDMLGWFKPYYSPKNQQPETD